jgi:hypothetical protein
MTLGGVHKKEDFASVDIVDGNLILLFRKIQNKFVGIYFESRSWRKGHYRSK